MKKLPYLLILLFSGLLAVYADNSRDKASYVFLEAQNAYSTGDYSGYYMLMRHAAALDPTDPFIAGSLAEIDLILPQTDSVTRERAYSALQRRFRSQPDEYNGNIYAEWAGKMGRISDVVEVWETLDSLLPQRTDPAVNLANALMSRYSKTSDTTDYNRAMDIYNRIERGVGPSVNLTLRKVMGQMLRNDTVAVVGELDRLVRSAPADVNTMLFTASIYSHLSRNDSALVYLNRAAEIDPDDGNVYFNRAEFFQATGDSAAFDREVFRALESRTLEFDQKFQLLTNYVVKLYSDTAQRPRIEEMFGIVGEINPGEADFHDFYGRYLMSIGRRDSAAEQFGYSVDLDPGHVDRWSDLCTVLIMQGDTTQMLDNAYKARELYPEESFFPVMIALIQSERNQPHDAIATLKSIDMKALESDERRSAVYATLGDTYYKAEMPDSANAAYARALELDATNYGAMNNCAYFNAVRGTNLDQAELYASMASSAVPDSPTNLDTYAWVLFKKKEYVKAKEVMDRVLELLHSPGDESAEESESSDAASAEVWDHAGDIYFMNGEPEQALEFWKKALELEPANESIRKKVDNKTYFFE